MLVPSMNHSEMYWETLKDAIKLKATTGRRLFHEYDRERRKLRINPSSVYPKVYPIKTKAKNTWLIFIRKAPATQKYKDVHSACQTMVLYYYDKNGLQAIECSSGSIEHYTAHFFQRYNERLALGLSSPLERVKTYFMNSGPAIYSIYKHKNRRRTVGISSEGFLLGELFLNDQWHIHKTFVSRNLSRPGQRTLETSLLKQLFNEMDIYDEGASSPAAKAGSKDIFASIMMNRKSGPINNINQQMAMS
jgi:hypothetical protein